MRQRQTHTATVYTELEVGRNELNTPMTETTDPIITFPVRMETSREEVDLDEFGSRVEREPFAICPLYGRDPADPDVSLETMEVVEIGDDMVVTDRWTTNDTPYRIVSIDMYRGRGNAPQYAHISLGYYFRDDEIPVTDSGGTS